MAEENEIRVAIFEDDTLWQSILQRHLKELGFIIVAIATNMEEAAAIIPTLESLRADIALIDGNLSDESQGKDGVTIHDQIKSKAPSVKTIGFSGSEQSYVDMYVGKSEYSKDALLALKTQVRPRE